MCAYVHIRYACDYPVTGHVLYVLLQMDYSSKLLSKVCKCMLTDLTGHACTGHYMCVIRWE